MIFITSNVTNWTELLFLSQKRTGFNVVSLRSNMMLYRSLSRWVNGHRPMDIGQWTYHFLGQWTYHF